jgi:diguanylate cyclase
MNMPTVFLVVLGAQWLVLCMLGWIVYRMSQSMSGKPTLSSQQHCGSRADGRRVRDLLVATGKALAEHGNELEVFEQSLATQSAEAEDNAHDSSTGLQGVEQLRRANRDIEQTVERTIEELLSTCGDLLAVEQSHLEAYQQGTEALDDTLNGLCRDDLLTGIAGKLLGMVHDLRVENRAIRTEVTAAKDKMLELMERAHSAEQTARVDALTRLPNRRAFDEAHAECNDSLESRGYPYCLILVDVDDFKTVNDQFGHAAGDALLSLIGRLLRDCCRTSDHVCRLGGDEFGVLLPRCTERPARLVAEQCRRKIASVTLHYGDHKLSATVSLGVAEAIPGETRSRLLQRADSALYAAKIQGRNRACVDRATETEEVSGTHPASIRRPRQEEAVEEVAP